MKRRVAIFYLSLSLALVLGHSFTPHQHPETGQDVTTIITKSKNLTLADLAKIAFSMNVGANHFEEYNCKKLNYTHPDQKSDKKKGSDWEIQVPVTPQSNKIAEVFSLPDSRASYSILPLRAPPVLG